MLPITSVPPLLLVALGGACGSMLRYLVGRWAFINFGPGFPFGTWTVNIAGGFAMGLLAGWLSRLDADGESLRLLLGVGVLGGFTTFSAFSLETFNMINRGEIGLAGAYAVSSVAGSVLAVMTGAYINETLMPTIVIADDDDGIRLDRWFQRHAADTSFNIVSRWARTGAIRLDGAKAAPGDRIAAGQTLLYPDSLPEPSAATRARAEVEYREPLSEAQIDYIRGMIIHQDAHAIVINKPPGLATQGGSGITPMSMACSTACSSTRRRGRNSCIASTRIRPASCCWRGRRAPRHFSRKALPAVMRKRPIGR